MRPGGIERPVLVLFPGTASVRSPATLSSSCINSKWRSIPAPACRSTISRVSDGDRPVYGDIIGSSQSDGGEWQDQEPQSGLEGAGRGSGAHGWKRRGPGPADRHPTQGQVIETLTGRRAKQIENPPAHRRGLGADHPARQRVQPPPRSAHNRIGPAARRRSADGRHSKMTGSQACNGHWLRVDRSARCQAATRTQGGHSASTAGHAPADMDSAPAVIPGQPGKQRRVIDLPGVVRMMPVQPRLARSPRLVAT
jgi:hypothetical protein